MLSVLTYDLCVVFSVSAIYMLCRRVLSVSLIIALVRIFWKYVSHYDPRGYLSPFSSLIYFHYLFLAAIIFITNIWFSI